MVKSTLLQVIILVSALTIKPLLRATKNDYSSSSTTTTIFYWLFHVSWSYAEVLSRADSGQLDRCSGSILSPPLRPGTAGCCVPLRRPTGGAVDLLQEITEE